MYDLSLESKDFLMMIKITKELLRKYDSQTCTEEEKDIVQQWLYGDEVDEEIDHSLLSEEEFQIEKDAIWSRLSEQLPKKETKVIPFPQRIIRYAAAACAAVGLIGIGYLVSNNSALESSAFEKNVSSYQEKGIEYKATHHSKIVSLNNEKGGETVLRFDGDLVIVNDSPIDQSLVVSSASYHSPYTTKKVLIRKGEKYVVIHNHFKEEEVMVINVKEKYFLPPDLGDKVEEVLAHC